MSDFEPSLQTCVSRGIILGAVTGTMLAIIDVVWALYRLQTASFAPGDTLIFLVMAGLIVGGAGIIIGALVGIGQWLIEQLSLPSWCSIARIEALTIGAATAILLLSLRNFFWPHWAEFGPFSIHSPQYRMWGLLAIGAVVFVLISTIVDRRWVSRNLRSIAWCVISITAIFVSGRVLYEASRMGPMSVIHAAGVVATIGVIITALVVHLRTLPVPRIRIPVLAALVIASVAVPSVIGAVADNQTRLFLYERTAKAYRLLSMNPGFHRTSHDQSPDRASCRNEPISLTGPQPDTRTSNATTADHVVLIVVDTTRKDYLGTQRDGIELTENLSSLSERSVNFDRAYAPSPHTRDSVGAMLSGKNPGPPDYTDDDAVEDTMIPLLEEEGIFTAAVPDDEEYAGLLAEQFSHVQRGPQRENFDLHTSSLVTESAIESASTMAQHDRSFLLVHYLDPHAPHLPADDFDFGRSIESRHSAEVASVDRAIGELLEAMDEMLPSEVAIFVLTDHGEEFWDHAYRFHSARLYEESVQLLAMMNLPGQDERRDVSNVVGSSDVMPTVLDLFDVPIPDNLSGRSWLRPPQEERREFLYSQDLEKVGMVDDSYKFIFNRRSGILELYDLQQDPEEQHNLADAYPDVTRENYCDLKNWMEQREIY